jgi:hypothetical protein
MKSVVRMGLSQLALKLGHRARGVALLVVLLTVAPTQVEAGNDDGILLGNDAALMGGAVVSTVNDGSALWYNPAGLALASENSVDVGASAFALRRYNMPGLISADGGRGGDASFTEIVSIPSALTYVRRFSARTVGGLALFASELSDYSLRTKASSVATPRAGHTQCLHDASKLRWQGSFDPQGLLPCARHFDARRMQKQPRQSVRSEGAIELLISVLVVACDGMIGMRGVHSDLVRSSGDRRGFDQGRFGEALPDAKQGERVFAVGAHLDQTLSAAQRVFLERSGDLGELVGPVAAHEGEVGLLHAIAAEQLVQLHQGGPIFGEHQHSAGLAIEAMRQLEARCLRAQRAQCLDDADLDPTACVHGQTGRLVEHKHVIVLEQHGVGEGLFERLADPHGHFFGQPQRRNAHHVARVYA